MVLMVPVSAFAAVVALAGPQRMAAEASMNEAAADLATLTVAWRDGEQLPAGAIEGFPPECISGDAVLVERCQAIIEPILADLGYAGIDINSLRGFYSDSLSTATNPLAPPCGIPDREIVLDAAHVALVADWAHAGWAAAQVWPDGLRMGGESIARLSITANEETFDPDNPLRPEDCGTRLDVVDAQGVPVRLAAPNPPSRVLSQSAGRTAFSG